MLSDKAEELLGVLDLHVEKLRKILLCLIVQLMKSHLIITPKSWWTAWACTQFSLCFLGIGLFSFKSHMQQLWICKELVRLSLVFPEVKCCEGSVPTFKRVPICP